MILYPAESRSNDLRLERALEREQKKRGQKGETLSGTLPISPGLLGHS